MWKACTSLREQRTSVSAVAVEGKVFAVGGHDGQKALSSVEVYDSDSNTWTLTTGETCLVCLLGVFVLLGRGGGVKSWHATEDC